MSDYVVSARKYRPESFGTLIGQDNIAQTLKNSIIRGKLAHAYLFCGPRGVGKTSMARIFAKTINCLNPSEAMEPCGECESCLGFKEGRSYCIHELDAASNNGVDDIKALLEQVVIPPQVGRYGVYIIDEVHMLSQAAFNAFLKTLEEPPAHAVFILCTTEKHKIIPTILSRCQVYDFNRIGIADMVSNLRSIASNEGVEIDDESLHIIAQKADGAMRDALTIFDQTVAFCGQKVKYEDVIRNLNVLDYEYSFRLVDAFLAGDYATALNTFDEILSKGFNALYFVTALSSHLRDLLVSGNGGLDSLLNLPDSLRERYRAQAGKCSLKFLYDALGITTACEAGYKASANQRLHIEYALMRLSFLLNAPAAVASVPVAAPTAVPATPVASQPASAPAPATAKPAAAVSPATHTVPQPASAGAKAKEDAPAPAAAEPAPEAVPATAPEKPKKTSKLSMAAMFAQNDEPAPTEETEQKQQMPSDERIRGLWQELVKMYSDKPRLASALENAKLEFSESDGFKKIVFYVMNEAQSGWIRQQLLSKLEANLSKLAGFSRIKLEVDVVAPTEEQEEKVYMPKQKAEKLIGENTEIKELVIDLGLDI